MTLRDCSGSSAICFVDKVVEMLADCDCTISPPPCTKTVSLVLPNSRLARTLAGGGSSYYVAVLGKRGSSNAVLLGDRIGAARLSIADRTLTIEYLRHAEGPAPAPAKVVRTLTLQNDQLVEQAPLTAAVSGPSTPSQAAGPSGLRVVKP